MEKTKEMLEQEEKELNEKAKKMADAIRAELGLEDLKKDIMEKMDARDTKIANDSVLKVFVSEDCEKAVSELTEKEKNQAFAHAVWFGDHNALKGLSETNADGGYTIPQNFYNLLLAEIYEATPMRAEVTIVPMKTNVLQLSMIDHGPNVYWTGEGVAKTTASADFSNPTITAYKMAAIMYLTDELIEDSAFDLVNVLVSRFASAIATEEDKVITNGNGTTQPTGLFVASTVGSSAATGLNFDNIIALIYSLPVKFRKNAKFVINPYQVGQLRLKKDTVGRYLWQDPIAPGQPGTIQGYPVIEDYWAPQDQILFGDLKYAYWLGDRQKMTVKLSNDTETTFVQDKTAIRVVERIGGTVVFPNALRKLTSVH